MNRRLAPILSAAALAVLACTVSAAPHVHEHGVVQLQISIEGERVDVALQAPLDSLLGFERAPRTDAERRAAAEALSTLRQPQSWLKPEAAAACALTQSSVDAGVLEAGAQAPRDGHAEVEAAYALRCTQPQALSSLEVGLFEVFKRIQRIEIQTAGANGQGRSTLKRPARMVQLHK
jgi:hypothetical protein